jgi:hypothetical protein
LDSELDALETIGDDLRQEMEAAESALSFLWSKPSRTNMRTKDSFDSTVANLCAMRRVSSSFSGEAHAATVRRVHFNEEVQEFLFTSDVREERRQPHEKDVSILDDVIGVFEDLLDELSFACVSVSRAMDRTRTGHPVRRSSVW